MEYARLKLISSSAGDLINHGYFIDQFFRKNYLFNYARDDQVFWVFQAFFTRLPQ